MMLPVAQLNLNGMPLIDLMRLTVKDQCIILHGKFKGKTATLLHTPYLFWVSSVQMQHSQITVQIHTYKMINE